MLEKGLISDEMLRIAARRLRVIPIVLTSVDDRPRDRSTMLTAERLSFLADTIHVGLRIRDGQLLDVCDSGRLMQSARPALEELAKLRGAAGARYRPLFPDFPQIIADSEQFRRKTRTAWKKAHSSWDTFPAWFGEERTYLATDLEQAAARQFNKLHEQALAAPKKADTHVEWMDVSLVSVAEVPQLLRDWSATVLYAGSSIKEAVRPDLEAVLNAYGVTHVSLADVRMRENAAMLMSIVWGSAYAGFLPMLAPTPTDLLRMFAVLTGGDVSLAEPIRFPKLNKRQQRLVLQCLNQQPRLAQSLLDYRGLWKALERGLHPHTAQNKERYPEVAKAYAALRAGTVRSFDSRVEAEYAKATRETASRRNPDALLELVASRPGAFARQLHRMLRTFPTSQISIMSRFEAVASQVPLKTLVTLAPHFRAANNESDRVVINKRGKISVVPNPHLSALGVGKSPKYRKIQESLGRSIRANIAATKESWSGKKVWIDPQVAKYVMPLSARKMSDAMLQFGRGSRIPLGDTPVVRLFTYWHQTSQTTDLDLSIISWDTDFNFLGQVSFTNLKGQGIVHSGDVRAAPEGAVEFIDIRKDAVRPNVRYIGAQVYVYYGESFSTCAIASAGWMNREKVRTNRALFDLKTVANKFDLTGESRFAYPVILDLKTNEAIIVDLYVGNEVSYGAQIGNSSRKVTVIARALSRFSEFRPTLGEVALAHVEGRGAELVEHRENADITVGLDAGCTFSANDLDTILAELV